MKKNIILIPISSPFWPEEFFLFIYSFRAMIEQRNSYKHCYYNANRKNIRGLDAAIKYHVSTYILGLLKTLTVYKLGRPDLFMKPSAFKHLRYLNYGFEIPQLTEESGFKIFKHIGL